MDNPGLDRYLATLAARMQAVPAARRADELREVRQHLDALVAGNIALGRSEEAAVAAAIRQFGRAEQVGRDLNTTWQRSHATHTWTALWPAALIYLCSALFIFGFFVLTNDKPTDFPYDRADQILLALVMPVGILLKTLFDHLRARKVQQQG